MNKLSQFLIIALLASSCRQSTTSEEHGHLHETTSKTVTYTLYSDRTELFLEFKPLVVGQTSSFAAHFTKIGETFTALKEGTVTLSLIVHDKGIRQTSERPGSPGLFTLALKPVIAGTGRLIFDIQTKEYADRIIIDSVTVFPNAKEAQSAPVEVGFEEGITFLKEQAWEIEFANEKIQPQPFHEVIRVSGVLMPKPSDEQVVTARSGGVVTWRDEIIPGSPVRQGQQLFVLTSGNVTEGNIQSLYMEAKANFEKAEADYKRVEPLVAEKVISQKHFLETKNVYEKAKIRFETLSKNYSRGGQAIHSPLTGFVKQITVRSGEYVNTGQPLAIITKDQSLQLRADVPLRYAALLPFIAGAQFKTLHDDKVYTTAELKGKLLSYGKALQDESSLLPVFFSLTNNGALLPGDAVEVYLLSKPIENAIVVPIGSLIEEQGRFYVYVQIAGERFDKRAVSPGAKNGTLVQIVSGLRGGERVVTRGAYIIKLATQSGSVPTHGHEH
jgi:membrane fusion protein, heavy metal efflux system